MLPVDDPFIDEIPDRNDRLVCRVDVVPCCVSAGGFLVVREIRDSHFR